MALVLNTVSNVVYHDCFSHFEWRLFYQVLEARVQLFCTRILQPLHRTASSKVLVEVCYSISFFMCLVELTLAMLLASCHANSDAAVSLHF